MLYLKDFMEEAEARVRKYWLILTFCFFLLPRPFMVTELFINNSQFLTFKLVLEQALITIEYKGLWLFVIWYCAYKMPGNKLLTYWLLVSPIWLFWNLTDLRDVMLGASEYSPFIFPLIYTAFYLAVFITWYNFSLKILTVNRILQKRLEVKEWDLALKVDHKNMISDTNL